MLSCNKLYKIIQAAV